METNGQIRVVFQTKNHNLKAFLFLGFALLIHLNLISQDVQFSQYYAAKFKLAPSFAGTSEGGRVTSIFRDQWPLLKSTFITYGFAFDYAFPELTGGYGAYAMQDHSNSGGYVITNIGAQYSYSFKFKNPWLQQIWHFRPGLQMNTTNHKLDMDNILFGSQLTWDGPNNNIPVNKTVLSNVNTYEAAISVLLHSDLTWFGASVDHLLLSKNSFSGEAYSNPVKFTSFGGICIKTVQGRLLYEKDFFYFSYQFKYLNKFKQLDIGGYWSNKSLTAGLWYRGLPFFKNNYGEYNNAAIILILGMEFKNYSIGYSFDYSLSKIGSFTGGAQEISLAYLFNQGKKTKKKKYKMVASPKF